MSRFRFIAAEKVCFPLTVLCRVVDVSPAGYSAWCRRRPSPRAQADAARTEEIRAIHRQRRQTYGMPRIHASLCATGKCVSRKRVAWLRRAAGGRGCGSRRKVRTTVSDPQATPAPKLVPRQFDRGEGNRVWVTDSTCLATAEGWLYLAAMLDTCARRVVGWALAGGRRARWRHPAGSTSAPDSALVPVPRVLGARLTATLACVA